MTPQEGTLKRLLGSDATAEVKVVKLGGWWWWVDMLPLNAKIKALSKFHLYKAAQTFYHVYTQLGSLSGLVSRRGKAIGLL
ncbi:hypothetical protein Pmani_017870 [Petrolisthes manimaculis]|uniref:Uncharacterized protein n=1 Tax=Petrolisthes manimaculis TaxID=1843537 RepID=A0AAE1PM35_9EUCA|nr:hypothetical protein Pmani_017870 [Petrolisthes manimaculis]